MFKLSLYFVVGAVALSGALALPAQVSHATEATSGIDGFKSTPDHPTEVPQVIKGSPHFPVNREHNDETLLGSGYEPQPAKEAALVPVESCEEDYSKRPPGAYARQPFAGVEYVPGPPVHSPYEGEYAPHHQVASPSGGFYGSPYAPSGPYQKGPEGEPLEYGQVPVLVPHPNPGYEGRIEHSPAYGQDGSRLPLVEVTPPESYDQVPRSITSPDKKTPPPTYDLIPTGKKEPVPSIPKRKFDSYPWNKPEYSPHGQPLFPSQPLPYPKAASYPYEHAVQGPGEYYSGPKSRFLPFERPPYPSVWESPFPSQYYPVPGEVPFRPYPKSVVDSHTGYPKPEYIHHPFYPKVDVYSPPYRPKPNPEVESHDYEWKAQVSQEKNAGGYLRRVNPETYEKPHVNVPGKGPYNAPKPESPIVHEPVDSKAELKHL